MRFSLQSKRGRLIVFGMKQRNSETVRPMALWHTIRLLIAAVLDARDEWRAEERQ